MFYCNDMTDEQVNGEILNQQNELKETLSPDFYSIYKTTIINNMLQWAIS